MFDFSFTPSSDISSRKVWKVSAVSFVFFFINFYCLLDARISHEQVFRSHRNSEAEKKIEKSRFSLA
jgi:hypothetical protein